MIRKTIQILLLTLILPFVTVKAQQFSVVDWNELRIDSLIPWYAESLPVDVDYQKYEYVVRVEYPELVPLTVAEQNWVKQWSGVELKTMPQVETRVAVSRGKATLDVSFIPVVVRENQYLKVNSCILKVEKKTKTSHLHAFARNARSQTTRYASSSVLKSGRWVKIAVGSDGVYQLSPEFLRQAGFSDPSNVRLFGYGGHLQNEVIDADSDFDDLEEIPLCSGAGGWLFYANGLVSWSKVSDSNAQRRIRNNYARQACYFLTDGKPATMQQVTAEPTAVERQTTTANVLYENDGYSWYTGGRNLYDETAFKGSRDFSFSLPGIDTQQTAYIQLVTSQNSANTVAYTLYINGQKCGSGSIAAVTKYSKAMVAENEFKTNSLRASNTLTVSQSEGRLDYLSVTYQRQLNLQSSSYLPITYDTDEASRLVIEGANSSTQLWRIGERQKPCTRYMGTLSGSTLTVDIDTSSSQYVAVQTNNQFPEPSVVGTIENQNLHAISGETDMVIIIPESGLLYEQAQRLADFHHRHDSLNVVVLRADQVYNEFGSGTPDATAYRRCLKMIYDRGDRSAVHNLRYFLLFGGCAWDNRMYSSSWKGEDPANYLLCYESENSVSETTSYILEDYFALMEDGKGGTLTDEKPDLGVGRFPVLTPAEAKVMVDKVIAYNDEGNMGDWQNQIGLFAEDGSKDEDYATHMTDAQNVGQVIESNHPNFVIHRIYHDAYKRETTTTGNRYPAVRSAAQNLWNSGALMMNYSGHATTYLLSVEQVFTLNDFETATNKHLPLFVAAACDVMPFDGREASIGKAAVLNPKGGAIAFFSTTRTVYADRNVKMNKLFTKYVLAHNSATGRRNTLGDAVQMAKSEIVSTRQDLTVNKFHFNLLGDPALALAIPVYKVVVDSINDEKVSSSNPPLIGAGGLMKVVGHVAYPDGAKASAFNGSVYSRIFDSEVLVTCLNNCGNTAGPFSYYDRTRSLFSGSSEVKNGRFEFKSPVPMDINYSNDEGRLSLYAVNTSKNLSGSGNFTNFLLGGTDPDSQDDGKGPDMFISLNTVDFVNGGTVGRTPYFMAALSDKNGLNTTGNGVGHDLELLIDGGKSGNYILNDRFTYDVDSYTSGRLYYSIPALSDGPHTLQFRAWDVFNNSSTATLDFNVDSGADVALFSVSANPNPARGQTTLLIQTDRPGSDVNFTLEVFDLSGHKVYDREVTGNSDSGSFLWTWNLDGSDGAPLSGPGLYLYRISAQEGNSSKTTKTEKLVVLRP